MPHVDNDASLDGQLELKKRSRRRLVGAAALALLAAIILPMVMDREPRQASQDIQIRIPSQEQGGFASRIVPNKATPTPLPPAEPVGKPEPKPEAKPEAKVEVKTEAKAEPKPPAAAPAKTAEPAKPVKPAEKPADKPAPNKTEEAKALAALQGGDVDGEQWVVQLGAYKETGNVKGLVAKLKQMNVPSYTESFDSPQGPRTRVRAGPFKSREAAERAQAKIRRIGVDGPVAKK